MAIENGKVEKIFKNEVLNPKTGRMFTVYLATINGNNYEVGYKLPSFKEGDTVTIEYETKYGKRKMTNAGAAASSGGGSARAPAASSVPARTFPVNVESPEMSIIRQSALKAAIDMLQHVDVNVLPTGNPHDLAEFTIELAYKFADFSSGQREVKLVQQASNE